MVLFRKKKRKTGERLGSFKEMKNYIYLNDRPNDLNSSNKLLNGRFLMNGRFN